MQPRRLRLALVLAVASLAVSLVGAELVFRVFAPRKPKGPTFFAPGGEEVPAAEIVHYLQRHNLERERPHPSGRLTPDLRVKQGYDNPRWDYFDAQGCITIEHNSLGFRDREFPVPKPPGEYRLLTLGDSFTYGSGIQLQDTWPKQLERLLQEGRKEPLLVINGGFAAGTHTPAGYDVWVQQDGLGFAPDMVIVGLCLNDMGNGNDVPMVGYPVVELWARSGPSHLWDYVQKLLEQRRLAALPVPDFSEVVRKHPETWNATQQGLRNLKAILDGKSIPLVVAVLPMLSQLDPPQRYPYAGLHTMAVDFCRQAGIRCVDLKDQVLGRRDEDLWADRTDQHPNHVGQRLLAEGIRDWLRRERLGP
jgi:lysophospholipase L1-like esterase